MSLEAKSAAKTGRGRMTEAECKAEYERLMAEFDRVQERIEARLEAIDRVAGKTRETLVAMGAKL